MTGKESMMKTTFAFILSIGLFPISSIAAESTAPVSGPIVGYAMKAGVIRPVLGIPGAARFGPAIDTGGLEVATVCSQAGYAVTASTLVRFRDGFIAPLSSETDQSIDAVRCSSRGTALAVVRGREIEVLSGLPDAPVAKKTVVLNAPASAVAVSDDGEAVASFAGGVLSLSDATGERQIGSFDKAPAIDFRPGTHEFAYTDGSSVMIGSSGSARPIAGAADGLSKPQKVFFSRDGSLVFITDAAASLIANSVLIASIDGGVPRRVELPCIPTDAGLMHESTLRVECANPSPTYLVELNEAGARSLFIPDPVE
jgi:hypothetical protein